MNKGDFQLSDRGGDLPRSALCVCLAASGGGHVRQLLDLEDAWSQHSYFFVTEDTALARSLSEQHKVFFVSHVALGQARLGSPLLMLKRAVQNLWKSGAIVVRERPDVLITTGAGAAFFALLWAKVLGAKIVVIESFARFDRPSMFARIAAPFADHKIVQSGALLTRIEGSKLFDPLKVLDTPRPFKKPLLFATVGATLPFDRLVEAVAQLKGENLIPEEVIVQTGVGGYFSPGIETFETASFVQMQSYLSEADIAICHGGTGSIITALQQGCRVIVMPRLYELGEHYDNHQAEIAAAFAARGLIEIANTSEDLKRALQAVRSRPPVLATTDATRLTEYLNDLLYREIDRRALTAR